MSTKPPVDPSFYANRAQYHREQVLALTRRSNLLSNVRGLTFLVFLVGSAMALFGKAPPVYGWVGALGLLAFILLIAVHGRVLAKLEREEHFTRINEDAEARISPKGFHRLAHEGNHYRIDHHAYADDLDLFGKGSLFQRLCVAHTEPGQRKLASYLLAPCEPSAVKQRQANVAQLAPELELRQEFEALARSTLSPARLKSGIAEPIALDALLRWAESSDGLSNARVLVWASRLLPLTTSVAFALSAAGQLNRYVILLLLVLHIALLLRGRAHVGAVIEMLSKTERALGQIGPMLKLLERSPVFESRLSGTHRREQESITPSVALSRLQKIVGWFELRESGLIYPFVNLYLLWDLQCVLAFEKWRTRHGRSLHEWFDWIAEMEALSSLAGLLHDEPNWCFAELEENEVCFEAEALGHPLIAVSSRVTNDVACLRSANALLVTGSNMSGKSTFLRSMGLAAVLGLAGAPVCASRLRISRMAIASSMRISDSLAGGVSHFYAELRKLKAVLDGARGPLPVFFLLDEILHGTNSRERQIGARYVLSELLKQGALGAVSTHDFELCRLTGELAEQVTLVHFRENVTAGEMTFDYRVRPGTVTEGNALRLMRGLGIDVPLEGS